MSNVEVPFWKPYVTWDMIAGRWEGLIRAGKLSGGRIGAYHENVEDLEERVAALHHRKYGIATHSGSGALMLTISVVSQHIGAPWLTSPAFTFGAIPHIAALLGMDILYQDIDPKRWTLDKNLVRGEQPGVVVPVCMFGNRPFWPNKEAGVVYDAAHGVGTDLGSLDPVCLSFSPGKVLNSIEGGMILTDDFGLAVALREEAFKLSRMSELEAAYALEMLERLPHILDQKKKVAEFYRDCLGEVLTFQQALGSTNHYQPCALAASHEERDFVIRYAKEHGVSLMAYYESLSPLCPVAVDVGQRVLAFPAWTLMTEEQKGAVVGVVRSAVEKFRQSAPAPG